MQSLPKPTLIESEECRARREEAGLTRAELAEMALVDAQTIYRFESGKFVSRVTRRRLARALDLDAPAMAGKGG